VKDYLAGSLCLWTCYDCGEFYSNSNLIEALRRGSIVVQVFHVLNELTT